MKLLFRDPIPSPNKKLQYERSGTLYYDPFLGSMDVPQKTAPRRHYLPQPYLIDDDDDTGHTSKKRKRRQVEELSSGEEEDDQSHEYRDEDSDEQEDDSEDDVFQYRDWERRL